MIANIPETELPRIVVIGAGFGGLKLVRQLVKSNYQIVLIDKENYHAFQPLLYQVATAGLEPSSIAFPLRKLFQHKKNVHIRIDEVISVNTEDKFLTLKQIGRVNYDKLVFAQGAKTNYFGNDNIEKYAIPMKSVPEALTLRNRILGDYEIALSITDYDLRQQYLDIVIVGGGPTGVEIAGALAEMKKYILPKDYGELNKDEVDIYLVDSGSNLLSSFSEKSSLNAKKSLESLGIKLIQNTVVKDYDGIHVTLSDGSIIKSKKLIWAAGISAGKINGLPEHVYGARQRILVGQQNDVIGLKDVYAIGDCALMMSDDKPHGDPQVAQVAIQQAVTLAKNLKAELILKDPTPFVYKDMGSMATIGRKKAIAEIFGLRINGFFAWLTWLFVHLISILGTKNKILILLNWSVSYFTRDQSLRLILKAKDLNGSK